MRRPPPGEALAAGASPHLTSHCPRPVRSIMPKVRLDVGATVDFLSKDELADELAKNQARAEAMDRERMAGVKYIRAPRIQGTVYAGTIGASSSSPAGTNSSLGGPPWGPAGGYA